MDKQPNKVEKQTNRRDSRSSTSKKILCAVSCGRDMAFNLNKTIKRTQEANGFVKPGGQTHQALTRRNTYNWGKFEHNWRTVLLIMCGTNDVAVNKADKLLLNGI